VILSNDEESIKYRYDFYSDKSNNSLFSMENVTELGSWNDVKNIDITITPFLATLMISQIDMVLCHLMEILEIPSRIILRITHQDRYVLSLIFI